MISSQKDCKHKQAIKPRRRGFFQARVQTLEAKPVKHQITESTVGADLATEDMKDSLSCIKSMKDCGPPVIERIIKTLQTASNQIQTNRQSRGSFSQLLPRPARTLGLTKTSSRASSFLVDWHKDSSTNKAWENFEKERSSFHMRFKNDPGGKPALPFPDSEKGLSFQEVSDLSHQRPSSSAGCDSAGKIFDGYTTSVLEMLEAGDLS